MPTAAADPSPHRRIPISSTIARGPSDLTNGQLNVRLALFAATVTALVLPFAGDLLDSVEDQSPTSLSVAAFPLALFVAWFGLRGEPEPSRAYPARSADVVIAASLIVPGAAVLRFGPLAFGWNADTVRLEMIGLTLVIAGLVALLLGSRILWLTRRSYFLVIAACPVWYVWALPLLEGAGLRVGWEAVERVASEVGVATVVGAEMRMVGFGDGTMVVVSAVCSGASSVIGVVLATSALACVMRGDVPRKVAWVASSVLVGLAANAVRLVAITVVGVVFEPQIALGLVHAGAGIAAASLATLVMLVVSPAFGLRPPAATSERILPRVAASAPEQVTFSGAGAFGLAAVIMLWISGAPVLDRLAGPSAVANADAAIVVPELEGDYVITETDPIGWVEQFYGDSEWRRFLVFDPDTATTTGSSPITVDVTTTRSPETFDQLDLAACYGFHGRTVDHRIGVDELGNRPAEEFAFAESGRNTVVVTWQTRVPGGVQRVAISQLDGDRGAVTEVAAAISAGTVPIDTEPLVAEPSPGGQT